MSYSTVSYTGNGVTTVYTVPFPYINKSDVSVTIGGVATSAYAWSSDTQITFTSPPANAAAVVISRNTPISDPAVVFTDASKFDADDFNLALAQTLYASQEVLDDNTSVQNYVSGAVISGGALPPVIGDNKFIVSISGAWVVKTKDEVKTILDVPVSAGGIVPTADAANKFLVTTGSGPYTYALNTVSSVKTLLSIGAAAALALPTGFTSATIFKQGAFYDVGTAAGKLPLYDAFGNAAFRTTTETGLAAGRVVALVGLGGGGGAPFALPACDGSQLTGIGKFGKYYRCERRTAYNVDGGAHTAGANNWETIVLTTESVDGIGITAPTVGGLIDIPAGKYQFLIRQKAHAVGHAAVRFTDSGGTTYAQGMFVLTNPTGIDETVLQCSGQMTLTTTKTFEVQFCCTTPSDAADHGAQHGVSALGNNIYTQLEIWKID